MDIVLKIKEELNVEKWQVEAAIKLIDEGNTIPFISRYRKEVTGSLNDEQLRNLDERLKYLRGLEERREQVLASIEEQGKMTDELRAKIVAAETMVAIEDLYLPYRPKRKTRASVAREKGLEGLSDIILAQETNRTLEEEAESFVDAEKGVETVGDAIQGAMDIIAEDVSDNADYRTYIREATMEHGLLTSKAKDEKAESVYEMYYGYEEPISKVLGHRILALNRGEAEKFLVVKIEAPEEQILRFLETKLIKNENPATTDVLKEIAQDAYERLIAPAIERDIRNELTEKAEDGAITVFGKNLTQLLMAPPIVGKTVLGWDPAFRTGCKLAIVDATGKVLDTKVIYPTAPQNKVEEAKAELKKLIDKYDVDLISVGNGTASRESEQVIVELIKELSKPVQYVIVNEAGASVYSASKLATEEFPQFDVGQRSAASIARRLQDPLAELVKIDPKSIGVGQYQHDMNQKKLGETLEGVVEDCVNKVGVDLNTASAPLLQYISGISKVIAKNIVDYREENGKFKNRGELLNVPKLGPKAYEQCAGFLRIADGDNPLDATSVHPESYDATLKLMDKLGITFDDVRAAQKNAAKAVLEKPAARAEKPAPKKKPKQVVIRNTNTAMGAALAAALAGSDLAVVDDAASSSGNHGGKGSNGGNAGAKGNGAELGSAQSAGGSIAGASAVSLSHKITENEKKKLSEELGIGEITLTDILSELEKPSRDPRENMPAPILRSDVLDMKDLKPGMVLKGTVRNVIDFGCFVDIGVHQDGLVHISHITDRYIKHPLEAVSVGDIVDVQVLDVEVDKKRISLTMKIGDPARVAAEAEAKRAARGAAEAARSAERKAREEEAKAAKKAARAASPVKRTMTKSASSAAKTATGAAKTAASSSASATKSTAVTTTASASKPASSTATATAGGAAPAKKFKKKGIVIFKGNAND
ncbi:RNA-binding transcriptional accessory protein [Butyrivibrio sp. XB500-5]|uniref:Tex family protein n=1 Tax=Butyrivibrio sp. XB500-5 TaxID=2364880 RepID=UPI000EAA8233|nr:Tex family protein [Butyrivibrio sp. XB500-5]RKM57787.1 RNA-binding transcriptional accessory protein [Butyrivibrio sp. XB500-5]